MLARGLCGFVFLLAVFTGQTCARETDLPGVSTRIGGVIAGSPSWREWKDRFLTVDGRIVDTGNKGVSHSEGQGYGLVLAAAANDRPAFDLIWSWTKSHLGPRADGLFTWRWDPRPNSVFERNNATDGDILIAWALGEGADLWNEPALRDVGEAVATAIFRNLVVERAGYGPVLLPGAYGFDEQSREDGPVVNPSYWIFPAFPRLRQLAPTFDWLTLERTGMRIIENAIATPGIGPADWLSLAKRIPHPARKFDARFGYDAFRIPLYLALAGHTYPYLLRQFPTAANGMPIVAVETGVTTEVAEADGYLAIAGLIHCAADRAPYPPALTAGTSNSSYYPSTLRLLAQAAALLDPRSCLDGVQTAQLRPLTWRPVPASLPAGLRPTIIDEKTPIQPMRHAPSPAAAEFAAGSSRSQELAGIAAMMLSILVGFCVVALRRRRNDRTRASLTEDVIEVSPAPNPKQPVVTETLAPVRRTESRLPPPLVNPQQERHEDGLVAHVQVASRASAQWNQYVGVIVLSHSGLRRETTSDIRRAISIIRGVIRSGDHVSAISPTEIGICLALLRDATDLDNVAARIDAALAKKTFEGADRHPYETEAAAPPFTSIRTLVHRDVCAHETVASLRITVSTPDGSKRDRGGSSVETAQPESAGKTRVHPKNVKPVAPSVADGPKKRQGRKRVTKGEGVKPRAGPLLKEQHGAAEVKHSRSEVESQERVTRPTRRLRKSGGESVS